MDTIEFIEELCTFVNEINIQEELKYIIKLSQILWVNALVKDEELSSELMDVIKMKSKFIQNYERNLVESAVETAVETTKKNIKEELAQEMKKRNYPPSEILTLTGVNILLK